MTEESHARLFWYHEFCHTSFETAISERPAHPRKGDAIPSRIPFPFTEVSGLGSGFPFMEIFGLG